MGAGAGASAGTVSVEFIAKMGKMERELKKATKTIKQQSDKISGSMKKSANQVDRSTNRIKYAFNKMRRAAQVVASAFIFTAGIRRIGSIAVAAEKAADKINLMQARFQQFARTGDAFTRIYNLSKNIGVSMDEAANGMTRLLIATKSIGTAQPVIEDVYKNIVTLGRAGGTSMEEMVGGMRQLSQGLASGRLAGEELRSVLENLPLVAMEIADAMGINIGQIREFAAEGKITSDVMVEALKEVGIKMEDLPQTWAMQTENLRTEWTLFLAELGNAVDNAGLLKELTEAVKWVRTDLMGDLSTHTIDELKAMREAAQKELVDANWGVELFADDPEGMKDKIRSFFQDVSKGLGPAGVTLASMMTDDELARLFEARERYRELNEEIAERIRLEQIAAKASEARGALDEAPQALQDLYPATVNRPLVDYEKGRTQRELSESYKILDDIFKDMDKDAAAAARAIASLRTPVEKLSDELLVVREQFMDGLVGEETWERAQERFREGMAGLGDSVEETTEEMNEFAKQAARNMQDAFGDFFFDPMEEGLSGLFENFVTTIRKMLAEILASQIMTSIFGASGSATGFGKLFGMASGGPVMAGTPYIVGEQGPELFMPGSSGMIVPNHKLGGAGGVSVNYSIDARGADEASVMARMIPLLERTKDITKNEVRHEMREGRFT